VVVDDRRAVETNCGPVPAKCELTIKPSASILAEAQAAIMGRAYRLQWVRAPGNRLVQSGETSMPGRRCWARSRSTMLLINCREPLTRSSRSVTCSEPAQLVSHSWATISRTGRLPRCSSPSLSVASLPVTRTRLWQGGGHDVDRSCLIERKADPAQRPGEPAHPSPPGVEPGLLPAV